MKRPGSLPQSNAFSEVGRVLYRNELSPFTGFRRLSETCSRLSFRLQTITCKKVHLSVCLIQHSGTITYGEVEA